MKTFVPAIHTVRRADGWANVCDVWPRARDPHSTKAEAEAAGRERAKQEHDRPHRARCRRDDRAAHQLPGTSRIHRQARATNECCSIVVGVDPGRSRVHAPGQRLAHRVLDRDDPGVPDHRLDLLGDLRRGAVAVGARVGPLVGVAGRPRRSPPGRRGDTSRSRNRSSSASSTNSSARRRSNPVGSRSRPTFSTTHGRRQET